jgi:hypothetical protein
MSKSNKYTVRLTDEQVERLKATAYELGYVWTYAGKTSGSITLLLVGISEDAKVTRDNISVNYKLVKKESK